MFKNTNASLWLHWNLTTSLHCLTLYDLTSWHWSFRHWPKTPFTFQKFILHIINSAWHSWWPVLCIRKYQRILQRFTTQEWWWWFMESLASASQCDNLPISRADMGSSYHFCVLNKFFSNPLTLTLQPIYYFKTVLLTVRLESIYNLSILQHTATHSLIPV